MIAPVPKAVREARRALLRLAGRVRSPRICAAPVFVLGIQKAGTSAIAALLGTHCGMKSTIDLREEIGDQLIYRVRSGRATIDQLVEKNAWDFANPIIKHPNLTFVYPQLRERFPTARFVFVVRHPHDNIRSILDRLSLSGDRLRLVPADWSKMSPAWRLILSGEGLGQSHESHIDALADRWNIAASVYLADPPGMTLVRYEDFVADKVGVIARLASSSGLVATTDIAHLVDRQFQPPGAHRAVPPEQFFSPEVLRRIEERCRASMKSLKYGSGERT